MVFFKKFSNATLVSKLENITQALKANDPASVYKITPAGGGLIKLVGSP